MPANAEIKSWIEGALGRQHGAEFHRVALQVNSFEHLQKNRTQTTFADAAAYNAALVAALKAAEVKAAAVTDHFCYDASSSLVKSLRDNGITVFPGFEAESLDGVHFLCVFDPGTDAGHVGEVINKCKRVGDRSASPQGELDCRALLRRQQEFGMVCVAAHVTSTKGLLETLDARNRAEVWKMPELLACSIAGRLADVPPEYLPILKNQNPDYRREHPSGAPRPIAILNAQDVSSPERVAKPGALTDLRLSSLTLDGLRQAFLDAESRVRRVADEKRDGPRGELVGISWTSAGFLDGQFLPLNSSLNVLIGGRGTGKSTIVESLRYTFGLEPEVEETRQAHHDIITNVLKIACRIRVLVRVWQPNLKYYVIERTVPNAPLVYDEDGQLTNLRPQDLPLRLEIYGQHEIAELARPERGAEATRLLDRFKDGASTASSRDDLRRKLERNRRAMLDGAKELKALDEQLAQLPGLEELLRRYKEEGIEAKLSKQGLLTREERLMTEADERIKALREPSDILAGALPLDLAFLSDAALEGLPNVGTLRKARLALEKLSRRLLRAERYLRLSLDRCAGDLATARGEWDALREAARAETEKLLREIQRQFPQADPAKFLQTKRLMESLQPLTAKKTLIDKTLAAAREERRLLLVEFENAKAEEIRALQKAAKRASKKVENEEGDRLVRVEVVPNAHFEPMENLLREELGGMWAQTLSTLQKCDVFSLAHFVAACRHGEESLRTNFGVTPQQAQRLSGSGDGVFMLIEELELPAKVKFTLNVAEPGQPPNWKEMKDLSKGQKATAILLLLLTDGDSPLVVDQPEDDLDNRFISEGVVPRVREGKRTRQFLFATHNANIPVLGDAELLAALSASGEPGGAGQAVIPEKTLGSIDSPGARRAAEEILEGGRAAFEMRRLKYGIGT